MDCVLLGTGWWLPMIPAVEVPVELLVPAFLTVTEMTLVEVVRMRWVRAVGPGYVSCAWCTLSFWWATVQDDVRDGTDRVTVV